MLSNKLITTNWMLSKKLITANGMLSNRVIAANGGLTSMPSWTASTATWASGWGWAPASLSARAALALPMFPRQTLATSRRRFFTHILAMFSHTATLQGHRDRGKDGSDRGTPDSRSLRQDQRPSKAPLAHSLTLLGS